MVGNVVYKPSSPNQCRIFILFLAQSWKFSQRVLDFVAIVNAPVCNFDLRISVVYIYNCIYKYGEIGCEMTRSVGAASAAM